MEQVEQKVKLITLQNKYTIQISINVQMLDSDICVVY